MHEPYDDDEDEYNDDQYNNDYQPKNNPYQWYYKFDIGPDTPMSSWLNDMINKWISSDDIKSLGGLYDLGIGNNLPGFPLKKFPVNSWNPNTDKGNSFQYLGSNYQDSPIWKTKYFVVDKINNEYKLHLQSHAAYFLKQPAYYKGLQDILN